MPPGTQLYHSVLCIVLQFLILRLMGRTITAVLTTFCFQMVTRLPLGRRSQPTAAGDRGGRGLWCRRYSELGDSISSPFCQLHFVWLWVGHFPQAQVCHPQTTLMVPHPPQERGTSQSFAWTVPARFFEPSQINPALREGSHLKARQKIHFGNSRGGSVG